MGKGKQVQVGHAAVKATLQSGELRPELLDAWLSLGQKKVCVKADDVRQLEQIEHQAKHHQILTSKIQVMQGIHRFRRGPTRSLH